MAVRRLAAEALQPKDFAFTPENEAWVQRQIAKYPAGRQASAVLPMLWQAQKQNDYWLPKRAIEKVAEMLGMPYIRVLEVATFYSMFNLEPVGRHFIQLCGTTPCMLRGAETLKQVCRERIGEQHHVSADGQFSWAEVECLGACCNAPMVQVNDDYFEDLDAERLSKLLDDLAAGRPVKIGSQIGRTTSEPELGKASTLNDGALFDGSRIGAWRARFEEEEAKAEASRQEAKDKQAAEDKKTAEAEAQKAKEAEATRVAAAEKTAAAQAAHSPPAGAHAAVEKEADLGRMAVGNEASNKDVATAEPAAEAERQDGLTAAQRAAEETAAAARLVSLPTDATPEQRADAVGDRPPSLEAAREGAPDDLKRIRGIGPINERKLNELGIYHFEQIGRWTRREILWVGTYLAFPGRIDREEWVGQAARLAGLGTADKGGGDG